MHWAERALLVRLGNEIDDPLRRLLGEQLVKQNGIPAQSGEREGRRRVVGTNVHQRDTFDSRAIRREPSQDGQEELGLLPRMEGRGGEGRETMLLPGCRAAAKELQKPVRPVVRA